jgi:hypothetical protein
MHSPRHTLVSSSLPVGGKRETNGNENGNEAETKGVFLCRNGNEMETKDGNESRLSVALVFNRDKITEQPFMQIAHQSAQPRNDDDHGSLPDTRGCSGVSFAVHSSRLGGLLSFLREMRSTHFRKL